MSITVRKVKISSTALNDEGAAISGQWPWSLFQIYSPFSRHLKWHLMAHQWSSMILGTIIRLIQLVSSRAIMTLDSLIYLVFRLLESPSECFH